MEDLLVILKKRDESSAAFNALHKKFTVEIRELFYGATNPNTPNENGVPPSPQQIPKRVKRLSTLQEDHGVARQSNESIESSVSQDGENKENNETSDATYMMPPPPPLPIEDRRAEGSMSRPQRAAKLKSEKSLREAPLNTKLRQPVDIKKESEQRASQFSSELSVNVTQTMSAPSDCHVSGGAEGLARCSSVEEKDKIRNLRVRVKRENSSSGSSGDGRNRSHDGNATPSGGAEDTFKVPMPMPMPMSVPTYDHSEKSRDVVMASPSSHADCTTRAHAETIDTSTASTKKTRGRAKKECMHKPIKVERFSDIDRMAPIALRTRNGAAQQRQVEKPIDGVNNETVTIANAAQAGDATFQVQDAGGVNANATVTVSKQERVCDDTFDVSPAESADVKGKRNKKAAPQRKNSETDDNDDEERKTPQLTNTLRSKKAPATAPISQIPTPSKAHRMAPRTQELFNPAVESPVKLRVAAFENAALAASCDQPRRNTRQKAAKDTGSSQTTPVIGKLNIPAASRFLTPTQTNQIVSSQSAQPRRAPNSASKAIPSSALTKTSSGTNLRGLPSSAKATLSRENSSDDLRKGLIQQREQKRLLATEQREAKLRERSEHLAKLAKEKEEKRLKKLQEQEQRKREAEEAARKLELKKRQAEEQARKQKQEEAALALKKAKAKEQERELLAKMNQQAAATKARQMLPPPAKTSTAYTFEMLHEDDSTDDESKVTYKRPPAPHWSRSHVRGQAIRMQQHCPLEVIDSFFSVEPTTPDLKVIFPAIDPRYLKRNSSVLWATPPRYSELPKY